MADRSDEDQARVFVDILGREIEDISTKIEFAESHARMASARSDLPTVRVHIDQAAALRTTLYELHRQIRALDTRFPGLRMHQGRSEIRT